MALVSLTWRDNILPLSFTASSFSAQSLVKYLLPPEKCTCLQGTMLSGLIPHGLVSASGKREAEANTVPQRKCQVLHCKSITIQRTLQLRLILQVSERDPRSFSGTKWLEIQLLLSSGWTTVTSHTRVLIPFSLRTKMAIADSSAPRFALKVSSAPAGQSDPAQLERAKQEHSTEAGSPKSSRLKDVTQESFGTDQEMGINLGLFLSFVGKRPTEGKSMAF